MSPLIQNLLLIVGVFISGLSVFLFGGTKKKFLKIILTFSGAYLFAITVLTLLPGLYNHTQEPEKIGLFILIGFLIQILLEYFSQGIEHGHMHVHKEKQNVFPVVMLVSLCIHAFLEGLPVGDHHHHNDNNSLVVGILIHNIPISIALISVLLESGVTKTKALFYLLIFAVMTPLGSTVTYIIGEQYLESMSHTFFDAIMALVIGIFLHISTTILFETSENHRFNIIKFATILLGCAVAYLAI